MSESINGLHRMQSRLSWWRPVTPKGIVGWRRLKMELPTLQELPDALDSIGIRGVSQVCIADAMNVLCSTSKLRYTTRIAAPRMRVDCSDHKMRNAAVNTV